MGSGWLWGRLGPQADQLLTFLPRGHLHRLGPTTAPQEPNRKTLRGMGQELAWHKSAANSATARCSVKPQLPGDPGLGVVSAVTAPASMCKESGSAQCSMWAGSLNPHGSHGHGTLPSPPHLTAGVSLSFLSYRRGQ